MDEQQTSVEIVPTLVRFLGSPVGGPQADGDQQPPARNLRTRTNASGGQAEGADGVDPDDLPF